MAARENQGYLVAVILLALLVIVLGVTTYIGMSQMAEYWDQREQYARKYNAERQAAQAFQTQSSILRAYIGVTGAESLAVVPSMVQDLGRSNNQEAIDQVQRLQEEYRRDIQRYGTEAVAEVDRTYSGTLASLADAVAKKHHEVSVLNENNRRLQREKEEEVAAQRAIVQQAQAELAQARNDLAEEQRRRDQIEADLQRSLTSAQTSVDELTRQLQRERENRVQLESTLTEQIAARDQTIDSLKSRLDELTRESYDVADGEIVRVFPNQELVYINRGSADGLRPRQSFSVFDSRVTNFERHAHKAKIEVTQVLAGNMAQARIVESNHLDPIMSGDLILSPVWDPGYAVPIALAGFFDLDGDGRSDLHRLIRMIEQNGGRVVAYHDEEGRVVGEVDASTRYIVIGDEDVPAIASAFSQLTDQADNLGVQHMSLHRLLNWMGISGMRRVEGSTREPATTTTGQDPRPTTDPYNPRR